MASTAGKVGRIFYKQMLEGDLRKVRAQSNDADTGGGARDFRFGSYPKLVPIIKQMFPQTTTENRKREGKIIEIDVFKGEFVWHNEQGGIERQDSFFESPGDKRGSEGRLARVPEYACLVTNHVLTAGNRLLLLLIQPVGDLSVWPYYAQERTLRQHGVWDSVVAEKLLRCLDAKRAANRAAIGFLDFISNESYCNGK